MSKLSPEEAWSHVKALWPESTHMTKFVMENNFSVTSIDWPSGVDRWPPKEEWRDAVMPGDWGKPARFRDEKDTDWTDGRIGGKAFDRQSRTWHDSLGARWDVCQVRVEPEETTAEEDGFPIETAPKGKKIKLLMGGRWVNGKRAASDTLWITIAPDTESIDWDEANQPARWKPL